MSEITPQHRQEIKARCDEEFEVTAMKLQDYLQSHGVSFLPSEAARAEAQSDPTVLTQQLDDQVAQRAEELGRDLTQAEIMAMVHQHYRNHAQDIREITMRIEAAAENSLALVSITLGVISYWSYAHASCDHLADNQKSSLYRILEKNELPMVWREVLDREFTHPEQEQD